MRGSDVRSGKLFSYVDLEERVPARHPLRAIRKIVTKCWRRSAVSSRRSIPTSAVPRSRRRSCCARCCYRCFTAFDAERLAALEMVGGVAVEGRRITLGADKGYDARDFVAELRERNVTPHVAQNLSGRRSAIDRRTTRHPGYAVSLRI